ncbi:MAG TPA: nucleoside-triphosphatase [Clostridia bacterium]|nr:nucleoside-triphosphatase [Clostridia bacterium]
MTVSRGNAFVHILTGGVDSGKTTRLLSIYREMDSGDGFINVKIYREGTIAGQRIIRLSSGESEPFSYIRGFTPDGWDEKYTYGNYSFSEKGLAFARNIVSDIVSRRISPVFIDEIGPLELGKKGFYDIFRILLHTNNEIYTAVRESCIESVIREFGISAYEIINPDSLVFR